jgi:hypothetical protein
MEPRKEKNKLIKKFFILNLFTLTLVFVATPLLPIVISLTIFVYFIFLYIKNWKDGQVRAEYKINSFLKTKNITLIDLNAGLIITQFLILIWLLSHILLFSRWVIYPLIILIALLCAIFEIEYKKILK